MILYSSSIFIFIYILTASIFAFSVMMNVISEKTNFLYLLKKNSFTALKAIPFCIVLFFLFPRIQGNLWSSKITKHHSSGLATRIQPGSVSSIAKNDALAFQIKTEEKTDLYFRAISFSRFDGIAWYPDTDKSRLESFKGPQKIKKAFIILNPLYSHWIPSPGLPLSSSKGFIYSTKKFLLYSKSKLISKKNFEIFYINKDATFANPPGKYEYQLPYGFNKKTVDMAKKWSGSDPSEIVKKGLYFFKKNRFIYSLMPPKYGRNYIDKFLFKGKKGFCEHFASAFAFMMRAAGVPARLIGGYLGGEKNNVAGFINVKQKNAHVWCEVWIKNRWIRIDPTDTAIMEDNIADSRESFLQLNDRRALPFLRKFIKPFTDITDAMNFFWNQKILTYNITAQQNLLALFGITNQNTVIKISLMIFSMIVIILIYSVLKHFIFLKRSQNIVELLWIKFQNRIKTKKSDHEGFLDYIKRLKEKNEDLFEIKKEFIIIYIDIKYGGKNRILELKKLLQRIKKEK